MYFSLSFQKKKIAFKEEKKEKKAEDNKNDGGNTSALCIIRLERRSA